MVAGIAPARAPANQGSAAFGLQSVHWCVVGGPLLQFVGQNQDDDADPDGEDREHDNQFLAIHTYTLQ